MFSTVLHLIFAALISNLITHHTSAAFNLETLLQTVSEHTNVLNEFPTQLEQVKALEQQFGDFQPRITVIEAHTRNLQSDVSDLTSVSIAYTERLDDFVTYQKKTDKLEYDIAQLLETVDTYGGSLSALDVYKRKTNKLEDHIIKISDELENNSLARNAISKELETFRNTCSAEQNTLTAEIKKINTLQEEQFEMSKNLDDIIEDIEGKKNSTSRNLNILKESCVAEQNEMRIKVQKLDTVVKIQDDTKNKLQIFVSKVEEHKSTSTQNLEYLRKNITIQENEVKTKLQKIVPLTKTQEETTKKLDGLVTVLNQLKNEQETLQKSLKQLSDQFETFIKGHTPPPMTVAPTTPTPDPRSLPVIIRKHIHARGNNIVVTI